MAHHSLKRFLIGTAGLAGLLIAALLALPSFIDADAYKPEIVAQVKRATGRDIAIDGPVRPSLLPTPSIELDGVRFLNLPGSKNPNMAEVKSVIVTPSLLALLAGDVEVAEVRLVEPKIALEIDAEGRPNWAFAAPATTARPPKPLSLGRLIVENGTLAFSDATTGLSGSAEQASFTASAGSIAGPFSVAGGATVNGSPLKIDLAMGARSDAGHALDVVLEAGGGKLSCKGTLSELAPTARLSGTVSASATNLVAFIETLFGIAGQPQPRLPPLLAGRFRFDGAVDLSRTSVVARDFTLILGEDRSSGSFALTSTPSLAVEASLAAPRLDLDRWLAALPLPDPVTSPPTAPPAPPTATPGATSPPAVQPPVPGWLAMLTAKLTLEAGEVIYNRKPVRDVALELDVRGGAVAVPKFTATLPGDLAVQARSTFPGDPARPAVSGDFSLVGPKLRETLAWLAVDVSSIPAGKLTRLGIKGHMGSSNGNVEVGNAVFELDDLKGTGGIVVSFTVPLSVVTRVELDRLDLGSYMPPDLAPSGSTAVSVTPILALLGPSIRLRLKVARIDYRGSPITGVDVDVARNAGTLRLNELRVANLAGARIAMRGAVASYWTSRPQADLAFDFEAPEMDRVLTLMGRAPSGLGALRLRGGVAGSRESLTLRDCEVDAMGWGVLANGTLGLPGATEGTITSASYKGSIVVNGQAIEAAIDANLSGGKPVIAADLRTQVLDFSRLAGSKAAAPRQQRSMSTFASQPIGTPLRSVDGTLKVSVASLTGTPMPLGSAEITATLKDGVLSIPHFKGGFYGGTISLSGMIDGSRPSLSFDLKGEVHDVRLGEVLRRASGTSEIGSLIRIAIDGRLNANDITLRGGGTTFAEIGGSLAGGARLTGHVQARADRFLQLLGSAATGAAGGVIDATLGNIMSVLGDKGGVGVGNLLNAISLVLNRFVNHDNVLAGDVEIAGGVLADRNLALQGSGATASIATRTDLANATTDTTINFMLVEEPSAPYLIVTARGPLGSPSFTAVRGAARDPPGVTGLFRNLPHVPVPNIPAPRIPVPHIPVPHIPNIFGR